MADIKTADAGRASALVQEGKKPAFEAAIKSFSQDIQDYADLMYDKHQGIAGSKTLLDELASCMNDSDKDKGKSLFFSRVKAEQGKA